MIKYLGSKRTLVPLLGQIVASLPGVRTCADIFSGTSRVGHAWKKQGLQVFANDHNAFAATLARCYVEADAEDVVADARHLIDGYNRLPGRAGWFTETFCEQSRFFQPRNGARVDAIRDAIAADALPGVLEAVLLVALMEAADRVDSTCGVQMAYLKRWAARSHNELVLRVPDVLPRVASGRCRATQQEAGDAIATVEADIIYLDPPYNQHSYLNNYHIWESLVRWDRPSVYGVACKRVDCRERKSDFNARGRAFAALAALVRAARARLLVVSFSDDGWITRAAMEDLLAERGPVHVLAIDYKRYVGAQIGIHNRQGKKVGTVGRLRNQEYIYIVDIERSGVDWSMVEPSVLPSASALRTRRHRARRPADTGGHDVA
jgi:adenine-specific DNA-methyltransferase